MGEEAQPTREPDVVSGVDAGVERSAEQDVVGSATQAVFGRTGGERRGDQSGVVRRDLLDVQRCDPFADPARRSEFGRRPQVAAGEADRHVGCGHGGEQQPMQASCPGVRGGQAGDRAVGLGEQGIGGRGRWQHPVGSPDQDDDVDVEPDGTGQRPDGDAVSDTRPRRAGLESSSASSVERNSRRVTGGLTGSRCDRRSSAPVNVSQARYSASDRRSIVWRPSQCSTCSTHHARPLRPRSAGCRMAEFLTQVGDERPQR